MRNKLIELIQDATDEFAEEGWKHFECVGTPPFSYVPTIYRSEYIADHLIANGVTIQKWIPVEERLPKPEQDVLVSCKQGAFKYQCTAFYIPAKWEREKSNISWDWECCEDYDEEIDDYYVKSGWYERIHNWDEYDAVGIADKITHWMPLPKGPKEEV